MPAVASDRGGPTSRSILVPIVVLIAVVALAGAALAWGGDGDATADGTDDDAAAVDEADPADPEAPAEGETGTTEDDQAAALAALERREEGDPLAVGDVDAPVVMIEWADFQCPFCGSFARDTKPVLTERFVDDGVLRIEWRDFPVLGEESLSAALAGRAAAEQDAFWELHDEIFAEDRPRDAGELDADAMLAMAEDLGLDVDRFADDMEDPALREAVQQDHAIAQELGVTGTPAFLVNGRSLIGGQPAEVFVELVEDAAAEAASS